MIFILTNHVSISLFSFFSFVLSVFSCFNSSLSVFFFSRFIGLNNKSEIKHLSYRRSTPGQSRGGGEQTGHFFNESSPLILADFRFVLKLKMFPFRFTSCSLHLFFRIPTIHDSTVGFITSFNDHVLFSKRAVEEWRAMTLSMYRVNSYVHFFYSSSRQSASRRNLKVQSFLRLSLRFRQRWD